MLACQNHKYNPRTIALSVLYLSWGKKHYVDEIKMNDLFNRFLSQGIDNCLKNLSFNDLLPSLK